MSEPIRLNKIRVVASMVYAIEASCQRMDIGQKDFWKIIRGLYQFQCVNEGRNLESDGYAADRVCNALQKMFNQYATRSLVNGTFKEREGKNGWLNEQRDQTNSQEEIQASEKGDRD